ncbi:MAG TPA: hypothetical protein VHZ81_11390 [Galbitalea sp.]|jgi:hypothetical protein|nr:hypothetical protein [Galbitalea sp.]
MTAQIVLSPLSQPAQLRRMAVLTWLELPRVVAVGLVWILLALPMLTGLLGVPWYLVALAALPSCLYATGLARFAAIISRGERPTIRDAFRVDALLGLTVEVGVFASSALLSDGRALIIPGVLLTALLLVIVPFALSYGAVRERTGFSAWRGGLILVAYRPGTAITVLALNCIGGFVVVASLGVLGVFVPCFLAVFSCALVGAQLNDIHARTGTQ